MDYSTKHFSLWTSVLVLLTVLQSGLGNDADNKMRALQDAFWESQMRNNPTLATWYGVYKYNDMMESFALTRFEEDRNRSLGFLDQLLNITRADLSDGYKVNYDILKDTLNTFLDGNKWANYGSLSPINFLGGIHLGGPNMAASSTRGDFENYIARLYAVQRQVDEIIALGRLAIQLNRTLHNVSLARVPTQIDRKLFDTPEESVYYSWYFLNRLNDSNIHNETERNDLRQRGRDAVTAYMDAHRQLKSFIVNEYMPNTRTEYGVWAWDITGDYYTECIKWHLSFPMAPDDVHNTGLEEVDKISKAMQQIMNKLNFEGTVAEFFKSLEGDERFYSNDTDAILEEYNKVVFDRIKPQLSTVFKNIPDIPLLIQASSSDGLGGGYSSATETSPGRFIINLFRPWEVIEETASDGLGGGYYSASETTPGRFVINLFRPWEVPYFEMMALSLHEAYPGHHLQHSYSLRADLPDFRKNAILSFYNVPNWFPYYSAYGEGWGLYSEYLGIEMGLYKDDYEMMGRYSYDILRAARLVVDTGLHYKKWSRQQAVEYLMNYTALGIGSAENEIDRYITWPGQACAYKLGEIRMRQLRTKAETELGEHFDLKDFHSLVLENGGLPMALLDSMTDAWIEESKRATRSSGDSRQGYVMHTLIVASLVVFRHVV